MSTGPDKNQPARRGPMILGIVLIGIGATAAMTAQTGLSFAQSASICLLACAVILLSFLIDRARSTTSGI